MSERIERLIQELSEASQKAKDANDEKIQARDRLREAYKDELLSAFAAKGIVPGVKVRGYRGTIAYFDGVRTKKWFGDDAEPILRVVKKDGTMGVREERRATSYNSPLKDIEQLELVED